MELEEITRQLAAVRDHQTRGGVAHQGLSEAIEILEGMEEVDDPPVSVDDGFVILPVARYEALREAEESLQETCFEPSGGEEHDDKQATIDELTRRLDGLCNESNARLKEIERLVATVRNLHHACDEYQSQTHALQEEIGRLKVEAKVRAEAAAPLKGVSGRQVPDEVLLKHIQDLQAEIDGIKDRLDEGCGEFNKIKARLDEQSDRLHGFIARMNRLEADIMPIRRIGPGTGPPDQQRDEATRDRLLQEIKRVAGGVESTKP